MKNKDRQGRRRPSKMPSGSPLIKGALVAAALAAPGCVADEASESTSDPQDMATNAGSDMEVIAPMPPPMVMPNQDMQVVTPMPPPMHNEVDAEVATDAEQLPPMPPHPDDMHLAEPDGDIPPMPPPMPEPADASVAEDMEIIPPMPRPIEDMEVEQDAEPPMPPPPMPPPMPPPRDRDSEEDAPDEER